MERLTYAKRGYFMNVKKIQCNYCKRCISGVYFIVKNNRMCRGCYCTIKAIGGYHGGLEN